MKEVKGLTFENQTLYLDDTYYLECKITQCSLIYTGGDFGWTDTTFDRCLIKFEGAAHRSLLVINSFGGVVEEFAKGCNLTPIVDPQRKVLLDEIERARAILIHIRDLSAIDASPYIKQIINDYFTPQAMGRAEGIAGE